MIQSTTANVVKVLENNFIGDSYTFDTDEPPRNNVGIKVTSMLMIQCLVGVVLILNLLMRLQR